MEEEFRDDEDFEQGSVMKERTDLYDDLRLEEMKEDEKEQGEMVNMLWMEKTIDEKQKEIEEDEGDRKNWSGSASVIQNLRVSSQSIEKTEKMNHEEQMGGDGEYGCGLQQR